jgi:ABC-type transport system involved in multi-copper enzyme maturation permease subunit
MVSPGAAMVRRELLATLRDYRVFLSAVAAVVLFSLLVHDQWPDESATLSQMTVMSGSFVQGTWFLLSVFTFIFVPAFAVANIVRERRQQTLDMIRLSTISPRAAIWAKMVNSAGYFLILTFCLTPVMGTVFFLVGVETSILVSIVLSQLCLAMSMSAAATYVSLVLPGTLRALLVTYLLVIILNLYVVPLLWSAFAEEYFEVGMVVLTTASSLVTGGIFYLLACEAWQRPRSAIKSFPQGKPVKTQEEVMRRRFTFPFYLIDPMREKPPIPDGVNPILMKELRWGLMNQSTNLVRVYYVSTFLIFVLGGNFFYGFIGSGNYGMDKDAERIWYTFQALLPLLVAPFLLATAFSQEKESGNLDMLRMTLVPPRSMLWGKFIAGVQAVSPFLLASMTGLLLMTLWGFRPHLLHVLVTFVTILVCCGMCFSVSLLVSMLTTNTSASIVASYVMGPMLLLAWPIFPALASRGMNFWDYTPLLSTLHAVVGISDGSAAAAVGQWAFVMIAHLAVSAACFGISVWYFQKRYLRDA